MFNSLMLIGTLLVVFGDALIQHHVRRIKIDSSNVIVEDLIHKEFGKNVLKWFISSSSGSSSSSGGIDVDSIIKNEIVIEIFTTK